MPDFVPPSPDQWKGPDPGGFVPPPVSSWAGPTGEKPFDINDTLRRGVGAAWENANPWPAIRDIGSAAANVFAPDSPERDAAIGKVASIPANAFHATSDAVGRTRDAIGKGDYSEAAKSAVGAIPLAGPPLEQITREATSGQIPEAVGHAAGLVAPALLGKALPSKIGLPAPLRNLNNPVEEAALSSVAPDIPMTVGQRTGNKMLQRVEQGMENIPGSSTKMQDFFNTQRDALAAKGNSLVQNVAPAGANTNPYGAGEAIQQRLQQRITRLKGQADNLYDQVRREAAANTQNVQVGTQTSPVLSPSGLPITTPVMKTLETPVDLAPVKANLAPMYDDLMRAMPEARRANSPAFRALDDLMKSPDSQMNAMDFDRTLSAIKSLARDGQNPYLTTKSQGLAKQVVRAGEAEFQKALASAGPNTATTLQKARTAVRAYHDTADLLDDLHSEPAALYSNLVTGGDRVLGTLRELNKVAPNELRTVGQTFLQGLMDTSTAEGGFAKAQGMLQKWDKLGPYTKNMLFGKQVPEIDNFMLAAKRLTAQTNPSGTAHNLAALGSYGAIGESLFALIMGHPLVAAAAPVGAASTRALAQILTSPGGPAALTKALTVPAGAVKAALPINLANQAFPDQHIERFAQQNKMTPEEAKKRLIAEGWTIQ